MFECVRPIRRSPSTWAVCSLLVAACSRETDAPAGGTANVAARRPNLILIVIDTLRADLGRAEGIHVATPNLDRLAAEGIVFPLAFSSAPMTLPSHTSLLSSRTPGEAQVVNNDDGVPPDLPLLPEQLRSHGYATHAVVSLSVLCTSRKPARAPWPGFDTFSVAAARFTANGEEVNRELLPSLDAIDPSRPFFLFAHYSDPHEPYDAHDTASETAELLVDGALAWTVPTSNATHTEFARTLTAGEHRFEVRGEKRVLVRKVVWKSGNERLACVPLDSSQVGPRNDTVFRLIVPESAAGSCTLEIFVSEFVPRNELPKRYALEVEYADRAVGELLEALRARDLWDSSLVVFTSDHGESLGERPLVGHVNTLFDEAVHVPLVVKLPKGSDAGPRLAERASSLASHIDLVPTLLELLNAPALAGQRGRSWLEPQPLEPAFFETHRPEAEHDLLGLRDEQFKLVYVADEDRFELYDLGEDPAERHDVFRERGAERSEWQTRLRDLAEQRRRGPATHRRDDAETRESLRALGYAGER
jgi:arylsulfatase A-like enzyme